MPEQIRLNAGRQPGWLGHRANQVVVYEPFNEPMASVAVDADDWRYLRQFKLLDTGPTWPGASDHFAGRESDGVYYSFDADDPDVREAFAELF